MIMYREERKQLTKICEMLYQRNLVTASDGNISMRLDSERVLITPSRKNKALLLPEEMIVVDSEGKVIEGQGRASSEFPMHKYIYKNRKDVNAIVHTHPVYATAFALAGKSIPDNYLIESKIILGSCALADYGTPGTMEMVDAISHYVEEVNSILLKNHGALTYGVDLIDAYNKMDVLESIAKTIIMSKIIGEPIKISPENMKKL